MFNVYKITNKILGLSYVGVTSRSVILRFYEHVVDAYRGKKTPLSEAIAQYSPIAFEWEVLAANVSKVTALELEEYYIRQYASTNREKGYNQNFGGPGMRGLRHTSEWRANHSRIMTGKNHPSYGTHLSQETKQKIRKAQVGKVHPDRRRVFPLPEIKSAYELGTSLRTLAVRYGTDKSVISRRLRELGVTLRPSKRKR